MAAAGRARTHTHTQRALSCGSSGNRRAQHSCPAVWGTHVCAHEPVYVSLECCHALVACSAAVGGRRPIQQGGGHDRGNDSTAGDRQARVPPAHTTLRSQPLTLHNDLSVAVVGAIRAPLRTTQRSSSSTTSSSSSGEGRDTRDCMLPRGTAATTEQSGRGCVRTVCVPRGPSPAWAACLLGSCFQGGRTRSNGR
jgi:hypothetical protein